MKIIVSVLFFLFSLSAFSQTPEHPEKQKRPPVVFHADLGPNICLPMVDAYGLSPYHMMPGIGLNAGMYADLPFGEQLYLETGIRYSNQRGKIWANFSNQYMGITYQEELINLNYFQVPLMIKAVTQNDWFAAGGLGFSYLLNFSDKWKINRSVLDSATNTYADSSKSGTNTQLNSNRWGPNAVIGMVVFGKNFDSGWGIAMNYEVTLLGMRRKSMYYNNGISGLNFVNSAFGVDVTYKIGKKN